ncbi:MAG TPA: autotransporter domain-containing protein [Bordetella sp.]|nr:autotransporter domain-containing protein [Bordetella sp.]
MQDGVDFVSLAIGGAGGQGGNSGNVTVNLAGSTISTQGIAAPAITAQSIGGGGGNGGAAHGSSVNAFFGTDITIGGSAGNGGGSGTVAVVLNNSTVTTAGGQSNTSISDSYGVLAQAIGGGGGNGGSAKASNLDLGVPTGEGSIAISTSLALGGSGGSGGRGGILSAVLENGTHLSTGGIGSHGVLAQTIGGGGGAGGASHAMSTTSTTAPDDTLQIAVSVALGGSAGDGGDGGQVDVHVDGTSSITTHDDFSNAMMAQSIGGGGGNAGVGSSKTGGAGQSIHATIGVGGKGGGGGFGGTMSAELDAGSMLTTFGSGSRGMLLQSIGGGGGASQGGTVQLSASGSGGDDDDDGYSASVNVSLGATGTTAGDGGALTVTAQGAISTAGGDADGILAQSIGGGGGLAGSAGSDAGGSSGGSSSSSDALLGDGDDSNSYALQLSVGGNGGIGGDGGAVSLKDFTGTIITRGTYADGIVLQSIGGGGGTGGTATASGVTGSTNVTMAVGGQGGAAGNGGAVTVDLQGDGTANKGAISTQGDVAYGLLVQSIGGGGGQGADGSANTAQSSDSTSSVTLGASGSSPNGGSGGKVNTGADASVFSVSTQGFNSHGVVLQSIGGGGGTASVATVGVAGDGSTPNFDLTLGGGGGNIGGSSPVTDSSGGHIGVEAWMNVQTTGEHAFGFVAQSIGGGGGIVASGAASNVDKIAIGGSTTGQNLDGGGINISIGNYGSQLDTGNPSVISTTGKGAHGVVLQSIGGGGGIAGYTANGALSAGWNGTKSVSARGGISAGGDVLLDYSGSLTTAGDGAYGIIAQSIADGGGLAGDNDGSFAGSAYDHNTNGFQGSTAGNVTVSQYGTLSVTGSDAYAIFAQSDGALANSSAVNVNISGTVTATASSGGGVWIDGTAQTNKVTILSGGHLSAAKAINQTGTGSAIVTNYGEVAGSMSLSDQDVALGTIENFGKVLRADNIHGHVINHGDFLVGESLGASSTHVTGDFTQAADGTLQIGADFIAQTADTLQVDGTARLNGKIRVNSSRLMPNRTVVFLTSDNIDPSTTPQGASSLFDYSTRYSGNQATVTVGQAHFDAVSQSYGAGRNLRELGSHLQDIWARGGNEELAGVYAMLDQAAGQSGATFTDALSSLAPGISAAPAALKQADMARFAGSLLSCPHYEGAELRLSESSCVWGNIAARKTSVDGSHGTSSFDASGVTYQVGVQQQIAPQWFVGVSAAYENGHMRADDGRQSLSGDTGYLGASLKYENGPWMVAGTLTGSYGSYDSTRYIRLPGINSSAKSSPDVMSLGQRLRVAYTHNIGNAYIKPVIDLDLIYTRMPSYSEHGAGALNLNYESSDKWAAILTPGVEVGGRIDLNKGYVLRPYLNVGLSLSSTDHWDSYAKLDSAPAGSRHARSTLDTGSTFGRLTAGMQLFGGEQFDVRLQYDGLFSSQVHSHGGTLKASWRY